ncbi:unnamed protein product [Ilex paraguariensis]|uniref:Uncharacterized protein n=1 Tax=Ilex paraguariensis TaxID=185542 RepID=A0ABC8T9Q7_9AQUA
MATSFSCFRTTPILCSASSNHRNPDPTRGKPSSSSSWWTPLFGWSSDPDYINNSITTEDVAKRSESETGRTRSRFTRGCFTEEKAKELRRKTLETYSFHDIMYHSAIASRLASDVSDPIDR